jgi:hypothetical protein
METYFAELNSENKVIQVILCSPDLINSTPHSEGGVSWIQTYKDGTRGVFAGIGMTYDSSKDKFIEIQPFPSWTLQEDDTWQSPVGPTPDNPMVGDAPEFSQWWDEDNQRFLRYRILDPEPRQNYLWDSNTSTWSEIEL